MLKELKNSKFALENLRNETDIFTQFKSDSIGLLLYKKKIHVLSTFPLSKNL